MVWMDQYYYILSLSILTRREGRFCLTETTSQHKLLAADFCRLHVVGATWNENKIEPMSVGVDRWSGVL